MEFVGFIAGACLFVFGGVVLGYVIGKGRSQAILMENDALRDKLNSLTDRDSKGRFVKRERK